MATKQELFEALQQADEAGNTEDAQVIADMIREGNYQPTPTHVLSLEEIFGTKEQVAPELNFFERHSNELALTGAMLAIIVIIISIVFLAKKYSYIRTMLVLSALYLMVLFLSYGLRYEQILVMSLPVLIFWGIRFIKHGASGIFKDKTKD
jgi:predicted ferric reductase